MFSLYIPNKLRIITIKFVKNIRNAFTIGFFNTFVFFKRDGVLFAFFHPLVVSNAFNIGIIVFALHQELVQSFSNYKCIGIATIETSVFASFKSCYKQQELNHLQCLVVRIDVAGEVVDLFLTKLVIRNAKEHEHSL